MTELDLQAAIRGDRRAVRAFIHEYGPVLRGVIRRMVFGNWREREDDLLQDLLLGLFRDEGRVLRMWDPQRGKTLKSFLAQFAQQRTLDWLRRQRRQSREVPTEDPSTAEGAIHPEPALPVEAPEWVQTLLERFQAECSPAEHRLVEMSYLQDISVREIAAELGLSEEAVYQRRHRIKQRLLKMKLELSR